MSRKLTLLVQGPINGCGQNGATGARKKKAGRRNRSRKVHLHAERRDLERQNAREDHHPDGRRRKKKQKNCFGKSDKDKGEEPGPRALRTHRCDIGRFCGNRQYSLKKSTWENYGKKNTTMATSATGPARAANRKSGSRSDKKFNRER